MKFTEAQLEVVFTSELDGQEYSHQLGNPITQEALEALIEDSRLE